MLADVYFSGECPKKKKKRQLHANFQCGKEEVEEFIDYTLKSPSG